MQDTELWNRLDAYDLPAGFLDKLMGASGWEIARARDLVIEYKRFLYLSQVTSQRVSPGRDVDQVWHMHLLFSRDYWDRLCANVLRAPLHHEPNPIGAQDDGAYFRTRALYEREFGPVPRNYWPTDSDLRRATLAHRLRHVGPLLVVAGFFAASAADDYRFLVLALVGGALFAWTHVTGKKHHHKTETTIVVENQSADSDGDGNGDGCGD